MDISTTLEVVYAPDALEAKTTSGRKKFWQMQVLTDGTDFFTRTIAWQELKGGAESEKLLSIPNVIKGKNIGKANETTPKAQAIFETNSKIEEKKRKDGYHAIGAQYEGFMLPMLAQPQAMLHRLTYPCVVQPKYDGERCLSDSKAMWSRGAVAYPDDVVAHLLPHIKTNGQIIDGELILPPPFLRQHTQSAAEKFDPEKSPLLMLRLYDCISGDACYTERYAKLKAIVEQINHPQILLAPYFIVNDEDEMMEYFELFKKEKWEGMIVKSLNIPYQSGRASKAMFKVKDFQDAEFQVIGTRDLEKGRMSGCVNLICIAPPRVDENGHEQPGGEFEATPIGKYEDRLKIAARKETLPGTWWTIRFQAFTAKGVPEFGRAVCERNPDISG